MILFQGSYQECKQFIETCTNGVIDWDETDGWIVVDDSPDDEYYYDDDQGSYDLSDDGDALASAGWGTDDDYGYFGDDE